MKKNNLDLETYKKSWNNLLTWWNIYKGDQLDISGDISETINQDAYELHESYDLKSEPCDFIETNSVSHDSGDLFFTLE